MLTWYDNLVESLELLICVIMSDKPNPPLELLPLEIPNGVSTNKAFVRLFDAGTAGGKGGSREDGGSTPALGDTTPQLSAS